MSDSPDLAPPGEHPSGVSPFDLGNPFLDRYPTLVTTDKITDDAGVQGVAVGIRQGNTTLSIIWTRDEALGIATQLRQEAEGITPLLLPGSSMRLPRRP